jgi:hypothetical protein
MRLVNRSIIALGALATGLVGAVAFAADDPIAPKSLAIFAEGGGVATSHDAAQWTDFAAGTKWDLPLVHPTYVRGPATIYVVGGSHIEIPAGSIVLTSWEPAIRGWQFTAVRGDFAAQFPHTRAAIPQGKSITLTLPGDLYRGPTAYSPRAVTVLPEVSGFTPFAVVGR